MSLIDREGVHIVQVMNQCEIPKRLYAIFVGKSGMTPSTIILLHQIQRLRRNNIPSIFDTWSEVDDHVPCTRRYQHKVSYFLCQYEITTLCHLYDLFENQWRAHVVLNQIRKFFGRTFNIFQSNLKIPSGYSEPVCIFWSNCYLQHHDVCNHSRLKMMDQLRRKK